jgi:hypothetical protein
MVVGLAPALAKAGEAEGGVGGGGAVEAEELAHGGGIVPFPVATACRQLFDFFNHQK